MTTEEGAEAPSYCNIATNDPQNSCTRRPSFELPQHLHEQFLQDEMNKGTTTHMDANTSHPKVARSWLPGK